MSVGYHIFPVWTERISDWSIIVEICRSKIKGLE
jgi:hypothetical protein